MFKIKIEKLIIYINYKLYIFLKIKNQKEVLYKISNDYKYNDCQFDFYIQEVILKLIKNDYK